MSVDMAKAQTSRLASSVDMLRDCLLCALFAAAIMLVVGVDAIVVRTGAHMSGWTRGADNWLAQQQRAAGYQEQAEANAADVAANFKTMSAELLEKERAIDTAPIQATIDNVRDVSADAAATTANVRANLPKIDKASWVMYSRFQQTADNIDKGSKDGRIEQKDITELTEKNLQSSKKAIDDFDQAVTGAQIPLIASHVDGAAVAVQGMTEDGKAITAHYKAVVTAPVRWWQHITNPLEAFGAKVAAAMAF
jgi:hypothetical protein